MAEACGGQPTKFITLTIRRNEEPEPNLAAKKLARAWRCVRLAIMRRYKWKKLPFFAVFERHKSGWPHLHILARCGYIDQAFISAQMQRLLNSPIVSIEAINNHSKIAGYVAKYLGKDPYKFGTSKRYWQSPDYDLRPEPERRPPLPPGEGWQYETMDLHQWAHVYEVMGWSVEWHGSCKVSARSPP